MSTGNSRELREAGASTGTFESRSRGWITALGRLFAGAVVVGMMIAAEAALPPGHVLGDPIVRGAEKIAIESVAPWGPSTDRMVVTVRASDIKLKSESSRFVFQQVAGLLDRRAALTDINYWVLDSSPQASGGKYVFFYNSPGDVTNKVASPDLPPPYGKHFLNTFYQPGFMAWVQITYTDPKDVYPERASDAAWLRAHNGWKPAHMHFLEPLVVEAGGSWYPRVLNIWGGRNPSNDATLLFAQGGDAEGIQTYYSEKVTTEAGFTYRHVDRLQDFHPYYISSNNLSAAWSATIAPLVPIAVDPPVPPTPTIGRGPVGRWCWVG